jgi:hypothetical protein
MKAKDIHTEFGVTVQLNMPGDRRNFIRANASITVDTDSLTSKKVGEMWERAWEEVVSQVDEQVNEAIQKVKKLGK